MRCSKVGSGDYGSAETNAHGAKDEVTQESKPAENDKRDFHLDSSSAQVRYGD